ncbi:MAG: cytochrome ubiquinol oxidase subunit I [Dissulfurimicrobium sp.]|uniref:cytochrome ubiquinol oxidase subunit I n=1 Tax=Dissulfurimicrobium sp. TaxID=2022436 RepID=UPI00404AFB13
MDVLMLSRLQFAAATMFHFLFVPLTLGLSVLTAIFETMYVKTGDDDYKRAAKFWGKLFLINFALGVVTGITLEFQFGTNWSRYSKYVGDIFGSILAIEATLAFFLESTFIGVWMFTWEKVSKRVHAFFIWMVAIASNISALWILIANGWMQHPVGYAMRNGRAELENFITVITNRFAVIEFLHTVSGAYILAGFFVMGISAYHLLRRNETAFFKKSFSIAASFALIFALFEVFTGDLSGVEVAHTQPAKLAAMESHWETQSHVPMYLLVIPDQKNERNSVQALPIPGMLSLLAFHDPTAEVKGLKAFPREDIPPVTLTFLSFRVMVGLGMLFIFLAAFGWLKRKDIERYPGYLRIMIYAIPLPYLANEAGWIVAEVGRQPWIVYGLMRTSDAVSMLATSQVAISLAAFVILYTFLGVVDFYLLAKYAKKGPKPA